MRGLVAAKKYTIPDPMPDPIPFPAGMPPGAATRLSVVGGFLLICGGVCFLWDGLPARRLEWGIVVSVLGAGFFSLGLYLKRLANTYRPGGFFLVTGTRRAALSTSDTDAALDTAPAVTRGENFAVELSLVFLKAAAIESAVCRIRLSERSEKRHGGDYLYKKLYEVSVESPLTDPSPGRGTSVRFAFLARIPEDKPPTDERRRWEATVIVQARGVPDFSATAPIAVRE